MKHSAAGWLVWADTPASSDLWTQQLSEPVPSEPPCRGRGSERPIPGASGLQDAGAKRHQQSPGSCVLLGHMALQGQAESLGSIAVNRGRLVLRY